MDQDNQRPAGAMPQPATAPTPLDASTAPLPQPKKRHIGRRILQVIGVFIAIPLVGWIWTLIVVRPQSSVTEAQVAAVISRIRDMNYLDLQSKFFVRQRVVATMSTASTGTGAGTSARVYSVENYTYFGIRLSTWPLNCWDVRPGIDGVKIGKIDPIGGAENGVWCDGLLF